MQYRFFYVTTLFSAFVYLILSFCSLEALDLHESIQLARSRSPRIDEARHRVEAARMTRWRAVGAVGPTVIGSIKYDRQADALTSVRPRFDGESYHFYQLDAKFTQPLLQRGIVNGVQAAMMEVDLSQIEYDIADRDLVSNVTRSFYSVLFKKGEVEILRKSKQIREQSLKMAERRSKIGRAQRLDVLQIQTQIALLEPKIQRAENELSTAAAQLAIYIGETERRSLQIVGNLEPLDVRKIFNNRELIGAPSLELKLKALQIQQTEYMNTVEMADYWPKLSGEGGWSRSGYKKDDLTNGDATQWNIGLNLTIPLFQSGRSWFDHKILDSKVLQGRAQQKALQDQWAQDQVTSREELETADAMIKSNLKAFSLAQLAVKTAQDEYRVSTIDYLQLLNTEQDLLDSELALHAARYDFIDKLIKFAKFHSLSIDQIL